MRKILAVLFLLLSSCASAHPLNFGQPVTATIQAVIPGSGWSGITAQPATQGNPADYGYADQPTARWDTVPWQTYAAGDVAYIGVDTYHVPTAADYAAGKGSNICGVQVAADGGSWTSAILTTNPDTGVVGWVVKIRGSDYADGAHELRAIDTPCTGVPIVLQGTITYGGTPTASISGNTMTVTFGPSDVNIALNAVVTGVGLTPNTYIIANAASGGTPCGGSACTGAGGSGTYELNNSQTVASELLYVGDTFAHQFFTNAGNSHARTIEYISSTGNDTTGNGTSTLPFATMTKAIAQIHSLQSSDIGNGIVCLQGTANYAFGSPPVFLASTRWLTAQATSIAPCDGVNPGTPTFNSIASGGWNTPYVRVRGVNIFGFTLLGVNNPKSFGWYQDLIYDGGGSSVTNSEAFGGSFRYSAFFTGGTVRYAENGVQEALMVRGATMHDFSSDALQDTRYVVNTTVYNNTGVLAYCNFTNGSTLVTNCTPGTSLFSVGGVIYASGAITVNDGSWTVSSIDPSLPQFTMNKASLATATGLEVDAGPPNHPDVFQIRRGGGIIVHNLTASTNIVAQGLYSQNTIFNMAVVGSTWGVDGSGGFRVMQFVAPSQDVLWYNNTWVGTGTMNWRPDASFTATDFSIINNTCVPGITPGPFTGVTYRPTQGVGGYC